MAWLVKLGIFLGHIAAPLLEVLIATWKKARRVEYRGNDPMVDKDMTDELEKQIQSPDDRPPAGDDGRGG